jgi:hypothetical protein
MKIYHNGPNARRSAYFPVTFSPAADTEFVSSEHVLKEWRHADGAPKQIPVEFRYGVAEVDDKLGESMLARDTNAYSRTKIGQMVTRLWTEDHRLVEVSIENGGLIEREVA